MKIPENAIPDCYNYAKEAFEKKITPYDSRMKINEKQGIKVSSARDYFLFYRYLITGDKPIWNLNTYTYEYFLKEIFKDYDNDIEQKKKSLLYFKKLIEKLEGEKIGSKKSMWKIYEKYCELF